MCNLRSLIPFFSLFAFLIACQPPAEPSVVDDPPSMTPKAIHEYLDTSLTDSVLYDKILGLLLGSAIGDAMGAPTEMWSKEGIQVEYGFVDSLDLVLREASPEGAWEYNLPAGGTTDDTRWKALTIQYLQETENRRANGSAPVLNARHFAQFLIDRYLEGIAALKATNSFDPEPFEVNARKMTWLQEWALVAKPFVENDLEAYARALSHFYGGEMSCAGMLYAPAMGAFYPGNAEMAYRQTYQLAIFDLGYARDLSALVAAMTAEALGNQASKTAIEEVVVNVDPEDFFKSRLIGRTAYRLFKIARSSVYRTRQMKTLYPDNEWNLPQDYPYDSLYFAQTQLAYELLDRHLQDIPFHAGEIYLINMTALLFSEMDFQKAMEFITNYGRDNDTIGAVCGAILGAFWGAEKLPRHLVEQVLETNRNELGIEIETLARQLTNMVIKRKEEI